MTEFLYLLPYLLSAAITIWIGTLAFRRRSVPGSSLFAGIALSEVIWSLGFIFQLLAGTLSAKLFWNNVQFLGAVAAPLAYIGFAFEYSPPSRSSTIRFSWKYLLPVAAALLLFIWTDGWHHLFRGVTVMVPGNPFDYLVYENGPAFNAYTIYAYSLLILTTIILVTRYLGAMYLYRLQIGIVLVGILVPWVTSIITVTGLIPLKLHDVTPISFGFSNLIIAWAFYRYHLFDTAPVARDYLFENMRDGVLVLEERLRIIDINPAAQRLFNLSRVQALGLSVLDLVPFKQAWFPKSESSPVIRREVHLEGSSTGGVFDLQISTMRHPSSKTLAYLVVLHDVNERKQIEERLNLLSITDPLTGIFNRRHVIHRLEKELASALEKGGTLAIILMDLDFLKEINDQHGHFTGDQALIKVAHVCRDNLRDEDVIGRYGGDEFLVVLPGLEASSAIQIANRLQQLVAATQVESRGASMAVSASLGLACLDVEQGLTLDELLERADTALYQAKLQGRNRAVMYQPPSN